MRSALTALFPPGRGGGEGVEYGYKGKGATIHLIVDGHGRPLNIITTGAAGDERAQVHPLLTSLPQKPKILYADKGYDADWLRYECGDFGTTAHIPYRRFAGRKASREPKAERWKVERCFAWLKAKYRRLCARYERKMTPWRAFLSLAISFYWIKSLVR